MDMKTRLHNAVSAEDLDMVRVLLERGVDPSAGYPWGETPLHLAAEHNNVAIAKLLLERGASADALSDGDEDMPRETPLDRAENLVSVWGDMSAMVTLLKEAQTLAAIAREHQVLRTTVDEVKADAPARERRRL